MTTHKAQTEPNYKAEVLKVYPDAEVVGNILQGRFFATSKRGINGVGGRISGYCQDASSSWESAYISLPKAQTDRAEGAKERGGVTMVDIRQNVVLTEEDIKVVAGFSRDDMFLMAAAAYKMGLKLPSKLPLPNQKEAEAGRPLPYL